MTNMRRGAAPWAYGARVLAHAGRKPGDGGADDCGRAAPAAAAKSRSRTPPECSPSPIQSTSVRFSLRLAGRRRISKSSTWTWTSPLAAGWRKPASVNSDRRRKQSAAQPAGRGRLGGCRLPPRGTERTRASMSAPWGQNGHACHRGRLPTLEKLPFRIQMVGSITRFLNGCYAAAMMPNPIRM